MHGGHSGQFCEHARGELRDVLEAAVKAGYHTFGVSEHAPRLGDRFLYPSEFEKGFTVARLEEDFENYASTIAALSEEFADRLTVLRGFEAEVVPGDGYRDTMLGYRSRYGFDYMVGSVHYVDEVSIDLTKGHFDRLVRQHGGLEELTLRYYETVTEMVEALRPDVVGHLDLVRRHAGPEAKLDTARIRSAATRALEAVRDCNSILDLNTAGYRKGLGTPYPAPWLVQLANRMDVGFCFGDDSHGPHQVGAGVEDAREYLLENGVARVTTLTREDGQVVRKVARL